MDKLSGSRQILEKCREYNIELHKLFIDFKESYDNIIRAISRNIMAEFHFPKKLKTPTRMISIYIEELATDSSLGFVLFPQLF